MKNILSILLLLALYSCTPEDTINPETEDVENEQGEENEEEINSNKFLIKVINADGTFSKYNYDSNGNRVSIVNEKDQLIVDYVYNVDGLLKNIKGYYYEGEVFYGYGLDSFTYDRQGELITYIQETYSGESEILTKSVTDSISYDYNRISLGSYDKMVENYNVLHSIEYFLDENEKIEKTITLSGIDENLSYIDYKDELEYFYDEKMRCTKIMGSYVIDEMSYDIEVNVDYTDYLKKEFSIRNFLDKNYLLYGSDRAEGLTYSFIHHCSDYYLKNIKMDIVSENGTSEIEYIYDYEFDEEGYPLSLYYSNPSSGFTHTTTYEWE